MSEPLTTDASCLDDDLLVDLVEGRADDYIRAKAEHHLEDCPHCKSLMRIARHVVRSASTAHPGLKTTTEGRRHTATDTLCSLGAGMVFERRFQIVRRVSEGGMGVVYKALDQKHGQLVALKLAHQTRLAFRMLREARSLARLSHPAIVKHIAHGVSKDNIPYLAMEWVEGQTLAHFLKAGPMRPSDALTFVRQVAEAIGEAHALGMVHRDLKPANLMLEDGRIDRARVLDFGLTRHAGVEVSVTGSGVAIGTPSYMAPEQARGAKDIDARADIFALGCVLFRCIAGRRPFVGQDVMAILSKVLLEPVPSLSDASPDVPAEISALVSEMLAKVPSMRPMNGHALADRIRGLEELPSAQLPLVAHEISSEELRVFTVMAMRASKNATTEGSIFHALQRIVEPFEGTLEPLADGSVIAFWSGRAAASDQATRVARCALKVRESLKGIGVGIATGQGVVAEGLPVGEVIDCAVALLREYAEDDSVRIDDVTAGLVSSRIVVDRQEDSNWLTIRPDYHEAPRRVLGRNIPCIGRDRETGTILISVRESFSESLVRAILLTGPAGIGKSRVRHQVLHDVAESVPSHQTWLTGADPVGAGSTFGLIANLLKTVMGVTDGQPLHQRHRAIETRVALRVPPAESRRVAVFLGELMGSPWGNEYDAQIREARRDAALMHDQIRRAWLDFVRAEASAEPLLIVLEDLHWGDLASVDFVDAVLRVREGYPVLVLATARPNVREFFPALWADRDVQELKLQPLHGRASELLVRSIMDNSVTSDQVARILERGEGNPFYLEELARATSNGQESLPGSVLAMAQGRLEQMEPGARRVLRAASVFGQTFWAEGVEELVGSDASGARAWLTTLEAREVIERRYETTVAGQSEYRFHHALLQEAAHGMLTDNDRTLGHRLAAKWLQDVGVEEPLVLAEHLELGGIPDQAAAHFARAARQSLVGQALDAAIRYAERGLASAPQGPHVGELYLVCTEARVWKGDLKRAADDAEQATKRLPTGSRAWCLAVNHGAGVAYQLGDMEGFAELVETLVAASGDDPSANADVFRARMDLGTNLSPTTEAPPVIQALLSCADNAQAWDCLTDEPADRALRHVYRCRQAYLVGDLSEGVAEMREVIACYTECGNLRQGIFYQIVLGQILRQLGQNSAAAEVLSSAVHACDTLGMQIQGASARAGLGWALACLGRRDEALTLMKRAIEVFRSQGHKLWDAASSAYLSRILIAEGDLVAAHAAASHGVKVAELHSPERGGWLRAALAETMLRGGDLDGAQRESARAMSVSEGDAAGFVAQQYIRLIRARVLLATGDRDSARDIVKNAHQQLTTRLEGLSNPSDRKTTCEDVTDNADIIALYRELSSEAE